MLEKDWHYRPYGILDATHLRFFTEKSLIKAFNKNGFTIDKMHGINAITDSSTRRAKLYAALSRAMIALTLGYFRDIQFLQFGFRIIPVG